MTTVLVVICMVWYTGDCLKGVTPSLGMMVLRLPTTTFSYTVCNSMNLLML